MELERGTCELKDVGIGRIGNVEEGCLKLRGILNFCSM